MSGDIEKQAHRLQRQETLQSLLRDIEGFRRALQAKARYARVMADRRHEAQPLFNQAGALFERAGKTMPDRFDPNFILAQDPSPAMARLVDDNRGLLDQAETVRVRLAFGEAVERRRHQDHKPQRDLLLKRIGQYCAGALPDDAGHRHFILGWRKAQSLKSMVDADTLAGLQDIAGDGVMAGAFRQEAGISRARAESASQAGFEIDRMMACVLDMPARGDGRFGLADLALVGPWLEETLLGLPPFGFDFSTVQQIDPDVLYYLGSRLRHETNVPAMVLIVRPELAAEMDHGRPFRIPVTIIPGVEALPLRGDAPAPAPGA